jgi:hypothetical protein
LELEPDFLLRQATELAETGRTVPGASESIAVRRAEQIVEQFVDSETGLIRRVPYDTLNQLRRDLGALARDTTNVRDKSRLLGLRESIGNDLRTSGDEAVTAMLKQADEFFSQGKKLYETTTAKRVEGVVRGIFKKATPETPGSIPEDLAAQHIFQRGSAVAQKELRSLIGDKAYNGIVRRHVQDAMQGAVQADPETGFVSINRRALEASLGFGTRGPQRDATKEMLRGTGVQVDDLERFVGLFGRLADMGTINVSDFVARRATLGGFSGAINSLRPRMGARPTRAELKNSSFFQKVFDVAKGVMSIAGARQFGNMLTDPKFLKSLSAASDPALSSAVRKQAFLQMGRALDVQQGETGLAGALESATGAGVAGGGAGALTGGVLGNVSATAGRGVGGAALVGLGSELSAIAEGEQGRSGTLTALDLIQNMIFQAASDLMRDDPAPRIREKPVSAMTMAELDRMNSRIDANAAFAGAPKIEGARSFPNQPMTSDLSLEALLQMQQGQDPVMRDEANFELARRGG